MNAKRLAELLAKGADAYSGKREAAEQLNYIACFAGEALSLNGAGDWLYGLTADEAAYMNELCEKLTIEATNRGGE